MEKKLREKINLWNCLKENKKVTLDRCTTCEYCTCLTDLSIGMVHRTCVYENTLIKDNALIDGYAEEEIMF